MSLDDMEWLRETTPDVAGFAFVWDPSVVYFVTLKGLRVRCVFEKIIQ